MDGESLFHADAVGHAANGNGLLDAAMLSRDDGALKDLDSFAGTFLDLGVDLNGVADAEIGRVFLQLSVSQMLDQIHSDYRSFQS